MVGGGAGSGRCGVAQACVVGEKEVRDNCVDADERADDPRMRVQCAQLRAFGKRVPWQVESGHREREDKTLFGALC